MWAFDQNQALCWGFVRTDLLSVPVAPGEGTPHLQETGLSYSVLTLAS